MLLCRSEDRSVQIVAGYANHEVKCAGCRGYFRLDRVTQEGSSYYCRKCYGIHKSSNKARAVMVTTCPVCGKELTPYDQVIRENGFSYCPDCHNRVSGKNGDGDTAGDREEHCSKCGKSLAADDARASYCGNYFCITCYDRSAPYLDAKPFWQQPGDVVAAMRTGEKVVCSKCRRDIGPMDVRVQDGGVTYCESCYRELRHLPEKRFFLAEQSGMSPGRSTTVLRNPESLVECDNCRYVATRDRLDTFPRDARGRLRCPQCNKLFAPAAIQAPAKAKHEKPKAEKAKPEDFASTAQLFKCLGDPCRVKIIESLNEKELCVFEFVDITGAQYSAISYHLKMLKELGIVRSFERGNFVVYSLTGKGQIVHEFIEKSKGLS